MNEQNVAYQMALKSREYVHSHNKEGWLGMFAEDGCIEDPIGKSDLDPAGDGHSTPEAREAFWDTSIANSNINITIHESYTADRECANILTLKIGMNIGGKQYEQTVNGVFTYRINDEGKLVSLRGYWEWEEGLATLREVAAS